MANPLSTQVEEKEVQIMKAMQDRVPEIVESDRDKLSEGVRDNFIEIVQALIDSAKGIWVEKEVKAKTSKGVETGPVLKRVYQVKPNTDVAQYLLNQLVGKPKETKVMEGRVIFKRDF